MKRTEMTDKVWEMLKQVNDPELGVNIVDMGLIYGIELEEKEKTVRVIVIMTLTNPGCPLFPVMELDIKEKVSMLDRVSGVVIKLVWDPPWSPDLVSKAVKAELGWNIDGEAGW